MLRIVKPGPGGGWRSERSGPSTVSLAEAWAEWKAQVAKIGPNADLQTGFPAWDRLVRPLPHQYVLVAARPGMFKTTWAWMVAVTMAMAGKRVLWLGAEMGPAVATAWAVSRFSGLPFDRVYRSTSAASQLSPRESSLVQSATEKFESLGMVLWSEESLSLDQMVAAVCQVEYDAVFLDYLGLVKAPGRNAMERIECVSETIRLLRQERRTHFVALAQMNREIERVVGGKPRVPNLSDLRGSGQLEADADVVAFLHREDNGPGSNRNEVQLRVEKNRSGPPGIVHLVARPETKEIYEAAPMVPADPQGHMHYERNDGEDD